MERHKIWSSPFETMAMPDQFPVFEVILKKRRRSWKWCLYTTEGQVVMQGSERRRPAAKYKADSALPTAVGGAVSGVGTPVHCRRQNSLIRCYGTSMSALRQEQPLGDPYGGLLAWIFPPNYFAPPRLPRTISDGSSDFESNNYWRSALTLRKVSSQPQGRSRSGQLDRLVATKQYWKPCPEADSRMSRTTLHRKPVEIHGTAATMSVPISSATM
jgi:hypothetical protein